MSRPAPVSQVRALEAEAVHVVREVVAELERPVLLFSGGKDSIALLVLSYVVLRRSARAPEPAAGEPATRRFAREDEPRAEALEASP